MIPSRGEGARLIRTVRNVRRLDSRVEIVVAAHAESEAVRRAIRRLGVRWADAPYANRGEQLRIGAERATGAALLFLHADTTLPRGGLEAVRQALARPATAGGAFRLCFDLRHPALALLARLSTLSWRVAFLGDQALFCHRSAYDAAGGFAPLPLFEDVDFVMRLARRGRLVRLPVAVVTSARRFEERGPWRQLALNTALLFLYHLGLPPARLAGTYLR